MSNRPQNIILEGVPLRNVIRSENTETVSIPFSDFMWFVVKLLEPLYKHLSARRQQQTVLAINAYHARIDMRKKVNRV